MVSGVVEDRGCGRGAEEPGVAGGGVRGRVAVVAVFWVAAEAGGFKGGRGRGVWVVGGIAVDGEAGTLVVCEGEEGEEDLVGPGGIDGCVL